MSEAGQKMIEGLKEAITMNSLMIENKMLAAELRQADDTALKQALTIKKLQEENETLRRDVRTAVMGDSAELQDVKRENEKLRAALKPFADALKDNYYHQVDKLPIIAGSNQMDIRFNWTLGDLRAAAAALKETGDE